MEVVIPRFRRGIFAYGAALVLPLVAAGLTYYVPVFSRIPWTLSFFVVATVAWPGGFAPVFVATLIASCGIYELILAPATHHLDDPTALIQVAAFDLVAVLIAYLACQRNRAITSLQASEMHYSSVTEAAPTAPRVGSSRTCLEAFPLGGHPLDKIVEPALRIVAFAGKTADKLDIAIAADHHRLDDGGILRRDHGRHSCTQCCSNCVWSR